MNAQKTIKQNIAAATLLREYLKEKHLDTVSIVIFRNGIFHWPVKRINLILYISIYGSAFYRYF